MCKLRKGRVCQAFLLFILAIALAASGCGRVPKEDNTDVSGDSEGSDKIGSEGKEDADDGKGEKEEARKGKASLLNSEGAVLETRVQAPEGFVRQAAESGRLQDYLRKYPLKEAGSPVLLYDGSKKGNQKAHAAVFALPIENEDLQQCADSIMRMYTEYFWNTGQHDRIGFHFVNGFYLEYKKWRDGYRVQVDGNNTKWVQSAKYDDSYENLKKYLRMAFAYAGTLSMESESSEISLQEIQAGDVFLEGGSPGHVVMVVDVCEDAQGKKAFLLAQGYMPAQEFHLLVNPLHEDDPWYYETEVEYPLQTPEYVFSEGSLRRLSY